MPLGAFLVSRLILDSKLFVTLHWVAFLMFTPHTNTQLMGRFVDVVWCDLNGTPKRHPRAYPVFTELRRNYRGVVICSVLSWKVFYSYSAYNLGI